MPGFTFLYTPDNNLNLHLEFSKRIDDLLFFDNYFSEELLSTDSFQLIATRYSQYPLSKFEDSKYKVFLEGKLFNKTINSDTVSDLVENRLNSPDKISEWIMETDGDFVIFIYDIKNQNIFILNDAVSRLPFYYYKSENMFVASREISIFGRLLDLKFSKVAFAQYLSFGCPLGENTLYEKINKLAAASLMKFDMRGKSTCIQKMHEFNLDNRTHRNTSIRDNAEELVSMFETTCKYRGGDYRKFRNIISLSGGLDSRCVVAGLNNNNIPFGSMSYSDGNKSTEVDLDIAYLIAKEFNIDWEIYEISKPNFDNQTELIRFKMGLNHLGMSFILDFFKALKRQYGENIIYFTGDGGDQVLPFLGAYEKLTNLDSLVEYIIRAKKIMEIDLVSELLDLDKDLIYSNLQAHVENYPEQDFNNKYARFVLFEKGFNFSVEGEDRNRYYFWSEAPFFSPVLYNYGMNCPDIQKRGFRLYRHFLSQLSPRLAKIKNASWQKSIQSNQMQAKLYLKEFYWWFGLYKIKKHFGFSTRKNKCNNEIELQNQLIDIINSSDSIREFFSTSKFQTIIKSVNSYSLNNLLTLFRLIQKTDN